MSYPAFIAKALGISFGVYLRYLPILAFFIFFFVALYLTTSDPLVHKIITFALLTVGWTYAYLMLLRGALYALKATTPANSDGTMKGIVQLMFMHFLAQLVFIAVVAGATYLFLYKTSLPTIAPEAYAAMQAGASMYNPAVLADTATTYLIFHMVVTLAAITITSLAGSPMAAVAANTAEINPNVDMITGLGKYFFSQFTLSAIGVGIPSLILALMMPTLAERATEASIGGLTMTIIAMALFFGYTMWAIPVCGMALAYKLTREEKALEAEYEARPVVDVVEHKASLREMRAQRQGGRATSVYDPKA